MPFFYIPDFITSTQITVVKENGEITTSAYTKRYDIAERTARNDLNELVDKQVFKRIGETNLAKYVLA
jgi:ATP-dependent DNA helicase RecG